MKCPHVGAALSAELLPSRFSRIGSIQRCGSAAPQRSWLPMVKATELETLLSGLPIVKIGIVTEEKKRVVNGSISVELDALVKPFKETLHGG
jgi:hypothetical protein